MDSRNRKQYLIMPDFNDIPTGLRVPSQIPLDIKEYFATLADMLDLGTNNNKAFTYYKGFRAYCVENDKIYIWREAVPELGDGLLPNNFTYPNGTECFGVDYSNKEYNFFVKPETLDLVSIGSGAKVYKGYNDVLNRHEFRSFVSPSFVIEENENEIKIVAPAESRGIPDLIINQDFIPTYDNFLNYYNNVYLVNGGTPLNNGDSFDYKGEGTEAKPFTDTRRFIFGEPETSPTVFNYTSIENGLEYYIGTGTNDVPQYGFRVITVRKSVSVYTTSTPFNINRLRLNIDSNTTVLYVSEDDIIDMNNASNFNTLNADIVITIGDSSTLLVSTKAKIKNSGNNVSTTNYQTGRTCYLKGKGTIYFSYDGVDAKDFECFSLDPNSNINGATGCNNDGNICIQVECNVRVDYRSIVKQGGNSKIEFQKNIITFNNLSGVAPDPSTKLFQIDGGLIRFFDTNLNVFNGVLGDTIEKCFSFTKVGTFRPNLVMRNVQFGGFSQNWFYKESTGNYNDVDVKVCSSLYFGGNNLFGSVADTEKWKVDFRNNVLENININFDIIDFTFDNNISSFNTIGNNVVEQLVRFPYRRDGGSDTIGNLFLPKYSKFINMQGSMVESEWFVDVML